MRKLTINAVMVCLAALGVSAPYEVQAWRNAPSISRTMEGDNVAVVAKTQSSPNGKVLLTPVVKDNNVTGFSLCYKKNGAKKSRVLALSGFGVQTADGGGKALRINNVGAPRKIKERYSMLSGKRLQCSNEANEVEYAFTDSLGRGQRMIVRLYNDGIAFRYELSDLPNTTVNDERTAYKIEEGTRRWMQKWTEPYEEFFPLSATGNTENRHWGYPALVQSDDDVWALITEAGIERRHSASSLYNDHSATDYRVVPDHNDSQVSGQWYSPWRVVIMGSKKDVVESTLVTDVSAPSRLDDTSWIAPGSVSWIYWAYNHGSKDYKIVCKYIDMAATLGLPYVLIDAEWDEMGNGGTIEDALNYAKKKGVKTILWYNSSTAWKQKYGAPGPHERLNAPENREKEFAWLEGKGVSGVKIDFFAGDKQETMQYCIDLLECAARHHLLVNLHGATVPRGWQRTYPNLMSVEAVYGAEWYNNLPVLTNRAAAHNATLPFTRNVIGSMDYTPCTFSDSQHPHITTNAHELALPVLFESALLHWADKPVSYLAQPKEVQDFMGELPTVWDETRFLSGYPGESVVMARRHGGTWYVAGINGTDNPVTLPVDLPFIGSGKKTVTLFADGENASTPWSIECIKGKCPASVDCRPRGGFVMIIKP